MANKQPILNKENMRKNNSKSTQIYGRHPVVDTIKNNISVEKIYFQQGIRGDFEKEIRHLTKAYRIPVQIVPKERLDMLASGRNHQSIIAVLSFLKYYKIEDVLPGIYERSEMPLILLLDGITDVRNMGAIARSAEVLGAHALVVPSKNSAQINDIAMKTSAGALSNIPVCRESSLIHAAKYLQESGLSLMSSDLQGDKMISEVDFTQPTALVIGSEEKGVNRELLKMSNQRFIIPQSGQTDSLNVSVATGIILYEISRQRRSV